MIGQAWVFAGFFLFVASAVVAAGYIFVLRPAASGNQPVPAAASTPATPVHEQEPVSAKARVAHALQLVGEALPASEAEVKLVRRDLTAAGYRWPSAVRVLYGTKFAVMLLLGFTAGLLAFLTSRSLFSAATAGVCAAAFGYKLIGRIIIDLIRARNHRLRRAMPAAVDLMVLAVEAGQGLDQALLTTSHELESVYPDLAAELALTQFELALGKSRSDALRRMGERNTEAEVRKLANLLAESDRFGTSAAPPLRSYVHYLRIRMRQEAQEKARKVSVKLIFPVFFLIFPSVLMVTLGPAVLQMIEQLRLIVGE